MSHRAYVRARQLTLSGGLVVAGVEGGGERGRGVGDVPVEMAASAAICEDSHAQHHYHAEQQGHHQAGVHRYAHTWGQGWGETRGLGRRKETRVKTEKLQKQGKHKRGEVI